MSHGQRNFNPKPWRYHPLERSPRHLGLIAIGIVFAFFGGFGAKAPLDSAAIAPGQVATESSTKPIQHLEGGIVREILVKEADAVRVGQVLFRLEPTQARANSDIVRNRSMPTLPSRPASSPSAIWRIP